MPWVDRSELVQAAAYAIARVIAHKHIDADPVLRKLDALGRVSAVHTMAEKMAPDLLAEADAAVEAVRRRLQGAEAA